MNPKTDVRLVLYAFLGLSLAISISASLVVAAVLVTMWMAATFRASNKLAWRTSPLDIPIAVYFAWGLFVTLLAGSSSFRKAASTQSAFLLFFLLAHSARAADLKKLAVWFCVGSGVAGLWGLLQFFFGINFSPTPQTYEIPTFFSGWPAWLTSELSLRAGRAIGPRSHPLTYAEGFIPVFFLLWVLVEEKIKSGVKHWKELWPYGLVLFFVVAGLLLAQGRGVWLGVAAGSLLMIWKMPRRVFWPVLGGLLVLGVVIVGLSSSMRGRFLSTFSAESGTRADQLSKSIRVELWKGALKGIKENPVAGVGLKGVKLRYSGLSFKDDRTWSETHNIFLQSALERGLIGFGIFLWILFVAGRLLWNLRPPWRWGFSAAFFAFLVAGITESWMKDKEIALLFWAMMGAAAFIRRCCMEESGESA